MTEKAEKAKKAQNLEKSQKKYKISFFSKNLHSWDSFLLLTWGVSEKNRCVFANESFFVKNHTKNRKMQKVNWNLLGLDCQQVLTSYKFDPVCTQTTAVH